MAAAGYNFFFLHDVRKIRDQSFVFQLKCYTKKNCLAEFSLVD